MSLLSDLRKVGSGPADEDLFEASNRKYNKETFID